jgi:hypothetical protein
MQTMSSLISQVLTKAARSKTTDELGVQDKQLHAKIRTHSVVETKKEKREIAATQTTERKEVRLQSETDAAKTTAISTSSDDFLIKREEEENRGVQHQCWNYKSRHKLEVKNYKSRHKPEVNKKLRAQYRVVIGLQVVNNKTRSAHLCFGKLSFGLLAEHEGHCVGPGLVEPTSRNPT